MTSLRKHKLMEICVHIIIWALLFLSPIILSHSGDDIISHEYLHYVVLYLSFLITFYANYMLLIDKLLFRRRIWLYALSNILLMAVVCGVLQYIHELNQPVFHAVADMPLNHHHPSREGKILNDLLSMAAFVGLSVILKMALKWKIVEDLHREVDKKCVEIELKNLKQQLSPHFVFNTLNNIYALVAIDADKAQQAILELSGLLRHLLYENKGRYVLVEREMAFVHDYIELMRLRQSSHVQINVHIDTANCNACYIAPLLFVPLIENAFKHGISPVENSFIDINIEALDLHTVSCSVVNTLHLHAKPETADSGIGLDNLRRQLQLLYPDKHKLQLDETSQTYTARLIINLHKEIKQ